MADYCTVADVKALAGALQSTDDALLATLVTRASAIVDTYTHRTFAGATATRYYTPFVDTVRETLFLDTDLLAITTLTNGDGVELDSSTYTLLPLNAARKNRIKLKVGYAWTFETDAEGAISVAGSWGYSATAPADVVQATARMALWLYRQRESPFSKVGNSMTGEYEVPVAMPGDIKALLDPYRVIVLGGI